MSDIQKNAVLDETSTGGQGATAHENGNDHLDFYAHDESNGPSTSRADRARAAQQKAAGGLITVQPLKRSEMQPSYAQDLGLEDVQHGFYGSLINGIGAVAGGLGQIPCCFCCPNPFHEVQQGAVGLISRFGQFYKAVDPGLVKINPCSETLKQVDVKIQLVNIPSQSIITRDNLSVEVDSVLYYHVSNPYRAIYGVGDIRTALIERAQTTLRDVVGSRNLQSVVQDREGVALQVEEIVEAVAEKWGVAVESILIKDIAISRELQESLSSAATQQRIGQSKIIAAKAEVEAAKLMRQAADILSSEAALQIRELEALQAMARSSGTKTIFIPMHLHSGASGRGTASLAAADAGASGRGATIVPGQSGEATHNPGGFNVGALSEIANM